NGRLDTDEGGADAKEVYAFRDDRLGDRLAVEERARMRIGVADDQLVAPQGDRAVADGELGLRQFHVAAFPADPERMLMDREDGVHRFVHAARVNADRARGAGRQLDRGRVRVDGERRQVDTVIDEERFEVDLLDLIR